MPTDYMGIFSAISKELPPSKAELLLKSLNHKSILTLHVIQCMQCYSAIYCINNILIYKLQFNENAHLNVIITVSMHCCSAI